MASNVPYSMRNELLDSGSDDEDSDVSDIATRTRATYTKKEKSRVPRPIEPNVQVQNEQEAATRSGEVSEDRDLGYGGIWSANKVKLGAKSIHTQISDCWNCVEFYNVLVLLWQIKTKHYLRFLNISLSRCFTPETVSVVFEVSSWCLSIPIQSVFIY